MKLGKKTKTEKGTFMAYASSHNAHKFSFWPHLTAADAHAQRDFLLQFATSVPKSVPIHQEPRLKFKSCLKFCFGENQMFCPPKSSKFIGAPLNPCSPNASSSLNISFPLSLPGTPSTEPISSSISASAWE